MLLLKILLIFIMSCFSIQAATALGLAFGGPSGSWQRWNIERYWTKNATHWADKVFNVYFYLTMSLAYFSYHAVYKKYGYLRTLAIFLFALITIIFTVFGIIFPFLDIIGFFDFLDS
ncbi:hypothetical protein [Alkalicoccobacillus porphyridii]|uniref:Uncharacterized protein n=1 Tax=Alkalicoccobacillus porphyridii TaxID=2597270 RepID=A0A553ZUU2_9BACI|nr:hypothetical protein [Alkalicoccobacillus porphyridii]TSB45227.1 hypothetical protein FN960_17330 [Alkalicoccobacillus porphyridii]